MRRNESRYTKTSKLKNSRMDGFATGRLSTKAYTRLNLILMNKLVQFAQRYPERLFIAKSLNGTKLTLPKQVRSSFVESLICLSWAQWIGSTVILHTTYLPCSPSATLCSSISLNIPQHKTQVPFCRCNKDIYDCYVSSWLRICWVLLMERWRRCGVVSNSI